MEKTEKKHHRKALWFLAIDFALGIIILCICLILLKHQPAAYTPMIIPEPQKTQVNSYLTHDIIAKFYNSVQANEPFTLELAQNGVNDAIAGCGWPQFYNNVAVGTPFVTFEPGKIMVMGQVTYDGADTVLTIEFTPKFDPDGKVNVNVTRVKAGAMGITFIAKRMAKKMYNEQMAGLAEPDDIILQLVGSALADKPFHPIFKIEKKQFRVDKLDIEAGKARVYFIPL